MSVNSAIFLDRDGTINEEMGYINHLDRFRLFEFSAEAIRRFNEMDYRVIVITNQSGVARGYFTEELLQQVHHTMIDRLNAKGARIDAVYYCPHHPDEGSGAYRINCDCRKPRPGMIHKACEEWSIDLESSYMIGDRYKDVVFAKQLQMKAGFVLTGYGRGEYTYQRKNWDVHPDIVGDNLLEVAKIIAADG